MDSASRALNVLKKAALLDFGIQGAGFIVATALKTEKFYDLAGSGTALLLCYKSLEWGGGTRFLRQLIQTGCVSVWAARLGLFLFTRVLKEGDRRFNKIKRDPKIFLFAWTVQGVWVLTNILPTLIQNSKQTDTAIGTKEYVGWSAWFVGFLIQAIADRQKSTFRADPANAGKFITSGLWRLSRHPNYFGEILMWTGLYISAFNTLEGWERLSVISPVFSALILTKLSGIPMLERSGMRRWGENPLYLKYLAETPALIPSLTKLFR